MPQGVDVHLTEGIQGELLEKNESKSVPAEFPTRAICSDVLNHHLSQKLKLIKMGECNNLINILTHSFTCGLKLHFNKRDPTRRIFNRNGR